VNRSACGQKGASIDNDPHFWTGPLTWGRYDAGAHKYKFKKIKRDYVIGSPAESKMLSTQEIRKFAPEFFDKTQLSTWD